MNKSTKSKIPKCLFKLKIKALKHKILERKYGYLFYRKTVSTILPSVAQKYHTRKTKTNAFNTWKNLWFEKYTSWRLILRAKVHHDLTVQRKAFKRWKYFVLLKTEEKIMVKIAEKFYDIKTKAKCFYCWYWHKDMEREKLKTAKSLQKYCAVVYLNFHVVNLRKELNKAYYKYLLKLFTYEGFKKIHLREYFNKWKIYKEYKVEKKKQYEKASKFFRSKFAVEYLKPHFEKLLIYRNHHKKVRMLKEKADVHYATKLKLHVIHHLNNYKVYRKKKIENYKNSDLFFKEVLKMKCLNKWKNYTKYKINKKGNHAFAQDYYCKQLVKMHFNKLLIYATYKKNCTTKIEKMRQKKLRDYFKKLLLYKNNRRVKHEQISICCKHYEQKILGMSFRALFDYSKYCKQKLIKNAQILETLMNKMKNNQLRMCFMKMKSFKTARVQKQIKIVKANKYYEQRLLSKMFKYLQRAVFVRKIKVTLLQKSLLHYKRKIFNKWLSFVKFKKDHQAKLEEAKQFYKTKLVEVGLKCILRAAFDVNNSKRRRILDKVQTEFIISEKYFFMWKNRVFKSADKKSTFVKVETEGYKWNPMCFAKPRIPNYLKVDFNYL